MYSVVHINPSDVLFMKFKADVLRFNSFEVDQKSVDTSPKPGIKAKINISAIPIILVNSFQQLTSLIVCIFF